METERRRVMGSALRRVAMRARATTVTVATVAMASLAPVAPLAGQDAPGSDEAAVRAELEAYYADFSDRDWDAFASHFWPGAALATVWQAPGEDAPSVSFTTVPDFVEQAPTGPGSREIFEERMLSVEIRVRGSVAQAWARYAARFGDPGEVMEWEGTDAFTLIRHDGRWRISHLAYASD